MSQELRNNMLVEINKFRVELQSIGRTPTVDDVVILQANLADVLLALIEKERKQPELLTEAELNQLEEPCAQDKPCPFNISKIPYFANQHELDMICELCLRQVVAKAQINEIENRQQPELLKEIKSELEQTCHCKACQDAIWKRYIK